MGFHEAKDLSAALMTVIRQFSDQSKQLFYLGHSMGATALLMTPKSLENYPQVLETMAQRLKAIVLDAPYYNFRESAEQFIKHIGTVEKQSWVMRSLVDPIMKWGVADKVIDGLHRLTPSYLDIPADFFAMKPSQEFAASSLVRRPIQLLHGTADYTTPYDHGLRVYQDLKRANPNGVEMVTLAGEEHVNRDWRPPGAEKGYSSALRGGGMEQAILSFLDRQSENA
jgi:pimeloyl-ACP methyl ester carboxylesterase